MRKKPSTRQMKKAHKSAAKQINEKRKEAPSKMYGKAVMKDDPKKPGRKIGYATVTKTKLPDYKYKKGKPAKISKRSTLKKSY